MMASRATSVRWHLGMATQGVCGAAGRPQDLKASERAFTRMELPVLCSVLQIKENHFLVGPTFLLQRLSFSISLLGISWLGETGRAEPWPGLQLSGLPSSLLPSRLGVAAISHFLLLVQTFQVCPVRKAGRACLSSCNEPP